ncbi:MAG: polyhydroxyalkanoate synthesis repressor PhaR [Alphaproteobacteria bacterium]
MSEKPASGDEPVTIKKYANRRLYNTAVSSYVTLDNLAQMVKEGVDFVAYDAKTGADITRSVLTQIIVEEEGKGDSLLPISFLRQLIGFYGDSLGGVVPQYLEISMETFARNQEKMREQINSSVGNLAPFKQFEEMGQANMKMFQSAMEMFTPFAGAARDGEDNAPTPEGPVESDESADDSIADLKSKLDAMQSQLNKLVKK